MKLDIGRVDTVYSNKNQSEGWRHSRKSRIAAGPTVSSKPPSEKNISELIIASIEIDIPQHPVMLHSMMARSSKHLTQLSNTLQELRVKRTTSRLSRGTTQDDIELSSTGTAHLHYGLDGPSAVSGVAGPGTAGGAGAAGGGGGGAGGSSGGGAPSGHDAIGAASQSGVHEPGLAGAVAKRGARATPGFLQDSFVVNFSISLGVRIFKVLSYDNVQKIKTTIYFYRTTIHHNNTSWQYDTNRQYKNSIKILQYHTIVYDNYLYKNTIQYRPYNTV